MFSVPVVFGCKALCAVNGSVLCQHSNAAAGHHGSARRVGLSSSMDCVTYMDVGKGREQEALSFAPLVKDAAIHGESRLAINADRPTEIEKTSWSDHSDSRCEYIRQYLQR